jgi:YHS domain-containing protein
MNKIVIFSLLIFSLVSQVIAQTDEARKRNFNIKKDVAIEGYDPVSYFDGKPMDGKPGFKSNYKGVNYLFSSQSNLEKFKVNPANFEPAYGGWCAFAMGNSGEKVKIDPETYKIQGGKLYLFYNFWGNNTLKDWNKNENELKTKGDANWAKQLH